MDRTERDEGWYWIRYRGLHNKGNEWCPAYWCDGAWVRISLVDYVEDADQILEVYPHRLEPPLAALDAALDAIPSTKPA